VSELEAARELSGSRLAISHALDVIPSAVSYPFGAQGGRERRLALDAGYTAGFGLAGVTGPDLMAIERLPVYVWSPPTPAVGPLRHVERMGAIGANRCAVGTTLWQRFRDREANSVRPVFSTDPEGATEPAA
jgi:hypothetical protein